MKDKDISSHLQRIKEHLSSELSQIRTGRANASMVENILVEAYPGAGRQPLKELGTISVADAQSIVIAPWDKSLLKKIEQGIREANPGLNPVNEGDQVRITIPVLTEERRKEEVKKVSQVIEASKVQVRIVRQDAIKSIEEQEDNGVISEDDMYREKKEIEKIVSDFNAELESIGGRKKEELLKL